MSTRSSTTGESGDRRSGPDDRVALVTGAAVRLGRRISLALCEAGFDMVLHYRSSRDEVEALAREVRALGRRAWTIGGDLSDLAHVARLFEEIEERAGRLDVLVNSAATFDEQPIDEVTAEDWERAVSVNLRAPFFCIQRAARLMRGQAEGGCVVNMVDLSGRSPWPGYAVHGTSKAGLAFLTRAAARELGPRVRVNAVAPGAILPPPGEDPEGEEWAHRGDHLPLARTGDPSDVCRAILYLVEADYVTGSVLYVDGGEHLIPGRAGDAR